MEKTCVVCGKDYECFDDKYRARGKRSKPKRPSTTVTCSKKCSHEYRGYVVKCRNKEKLKIVLEERRNGILRRN